MSVIPLQIKGIDHVVLKVENLERSLEFYVKVLGLRVERIVKEFGFAQLRCGRSLIDLQSVAPGQQLPKADNGSIDHVCLNVEGDMDEIVAYLDAQQVKMRSLPSEVYGATGFGTSVYAYDPDAHVIEMKTDHCQYPVKTTPEEARNSLTRPLAS